MASKSTAATELGLRERNKLEKLQRIKMAARDLFISHGFDETTTRAIAARADVGMGTIFLYAENKRDLLFLIANDQLELIVDEGFNELRPHGAVLTNLMRAFRLHYAFFGEQPALSRMMLREMMFYESGQQADRFRQIRERLIGLVTEIVKAGQERGAVRTSETAEFIGWVVFCIYQVELRHWLAADAPDLQAGMKRLEKALKLFMSGAAVRAN